MAKMNSKFRYMYDAAPTIALITKDGVAKTATFNGVTHTLDKLEGWWNTAGEIADTVFAIAINVDALDHTTGDETYTIALQVGDDGFTHSVTTQSIAVAAPGQYVLLVDMPTIVALLGAYKPTSLRLVATLAGTTPSFTGYAWMAGEIIDGQ